MALFEYCPNYIWNLILAIALESGARTGEILDMRQPLEDAAGAGSDVGSGTFAR